VEGILGQMRKCKFSLVFAGLTVFLYLSDVRELKKAKKDGNITEALLNRRMKLKSDRYC
jgi:hypothetical protein